MSLFIDAINYLQNEVKLILIEEDNSNFNETMKISTFRHSFGKIAFDGDFEKIPDHLMDLVKNAVQMLAVILENCKKAELISEELKNVELRYKTLFDQSPDGVLLVDTNSTLPIEFNDAACRQLGYSKEEFSKMKVSDYDVYENLEDAKAHIQKASINGRDDFETKHRMKDGELRDVSVTVKAIELKNKPYLLAIHRDITEKKKLDRDLRESKAHIAEANQIMAGVLAHTHMMAALLDREFNYIWVNRAYAETCRHDISFFPGKNHFELYPHEENQEIFQNVVDTGEPFLVDAKPFEFPDQPERGITYWDWSLIPVKDSAGKVKSLVFTLAEVTARKKAENVVKEYSERLELMVEERTDELKKTQEQLLRKEKLAVIGQLAASVAHEIRNPLGVISNSIYFLKMTLSDADEKTKEYLEMISEEIWKSNKIVSELLDLSRVKALNKEKIKFDSLISRILNTNPAPENINFKSHINSNLPLIFVDPDKITQVLLNLLTNSYQAMPDGGDLIINAQLEKNELQLSVTDTGKGISKENLEKIFEPLFTTRARGIGLGLAVCKNLIEIHNGNLEVESTEGKGSTFTISLPVEDNADNE